MDSNRSGGTLPSNICVFYLRGICLQICIYYLTGKRHDFKHIFCIYCLLLFEGHMPSNTLYLFIICKSCMPSKQLILTKDMHVLSAYLCVIFRKVCAHFTTVETSAEQCDSVEYHRQKTIGKLKEKKDQFISQSYEYSTTVRRTFHKILSAIIGGTPFPQTVLTD